MKRTSSPDRIGEASIHPIPYPDSAALPSKEVVGSKAHNLMRMAGCGLKVPPGFVLGTEVCRAFLKDARGTLAAIRPLVSAEMARLEAATGRYFGDARRPLLVSVRSGAAISMPGMMETVLNIGLNAASVRGLLRSRGNPRLVQDCRRRLIEQYGEVVHGVNPKLFHEALRSCLDAVGAMAIEELGSSDLQRLADAYVSAFEGAVGSDFPDDPRAQLDGAIEAVLLSWSSDRAREYRRLNGIPDDIGTAVTVQAMVFGNAGPASGSGVGFTRNPSDGANEVFVDYLSNAQGEDVVSGRRRAAGLDELERRLPEAHRGLIAAARVLEHEFTDMQDFEFTIEDGKLHMLQSRTGKRMPLAAIQIAVDLVEEGLVTPAEALSRLDGLNIDTIEVRKLVAGEGAAPLVKGTPASTGVAVGVAVFDPARLDAHFVNGRPVVLVRQNADTADIGALAKSAALITVEGARTSHAAVVARQLGKVCVVGTDGLRIDPSGRRGTFGAVLLEEGEIVTVDGGTGQIYRGELRLVAQRPTALIEKVESWQSDAHPRPKPIARKKRVH